MPQKTAAADHNHAENNAVHQINPLAQDVWNKNVKSTKPPLNRLVKAMLSSPANHEQFCW